jgi:hypothetical protein
MKLPMQDEDIKCERRSRHLTHGGVNLMGGFKKVFLPLADGANRVHVPT